MEKKTLPISVRFLGYCRGANLTGVKTLLADLNVMESETIYKGIYNALKKDSEVVLRFLIDLPNFKPCLKFERKCWYLAHRFGTESLLECFSRYGTSAHCKIPALLGVARRGNVSVFRNFYIPFLIDPGKTKAIFEAGRLGHIDIVLWVCEQDRPEANEAAIKGACYGAQKELISCLIQRGYFRLVESINDIVERGHLDLLKAILKQLGVTPKTEKTVAWDRVVYIAVGAGHWRIAKYLVDSGIDISQLPTNFHIHHRYKRQPKLMYKLLALPIPFQWDHPNILVKMTIQNYDVAFLEACLRAGYNKLGVYVLTQPIRGLRYMCLALLIRGWDLEPMLVQEFQQHFQQNEEYQHYIEPTDMTLTLHLTQQRTTLAWLREFLSPILKPNPTQLCLLYI